MNKLILPLKCADGLVVRTIRKSSSLSVGSPLSHGMEFQKKLEQFKQKFGIYQCNDPFENWVGEMKTEHDSFMPLFMLNVEQGVDATNTENEIPRLSLTPLFDLQKAQQGIIETKYDFSKTRPLSMDFTSRDDLASRGISKNSALYKACHVKNKKIEDTVVMDATTGIGKDSMILSQFGFKLICCERHPLISLMLSSAIGRARESGNLQNVLHLFTNTDSRSVDRQLLNEHSLQIPDVVYIDPMFSHVGSALPKYDLQILRQLMSMVEFDQPFVSSSTDDSFEQSLVVWALELGVKRVVLKRPRKSPNVMKDHLVHSYSDGDKGDIRYDLFMNT